MKTRSLSFVLLIIIFASVVPLAAQDGEPPIQESPEAGVQAYFEFLFSATPEDYDFLPFYICADYLYNRGRFEEIIDALGGAEVDLSTVNFIVETLDPDTLMGEMFIGGEPTVTLPGGDPPTVILPQRIPVLFDGRWKVCPSFGRHVTVIRASDLALTQDDAFIAGVAFYNAFYTGDQEGVAALSCVEKREINAQAAANNFSDGYAIQPSDWDILLNPDGLEFTISTIGTLELSHQERTVVATERRDFPRARLVRENGWKFCDGFREDELAILKFVRTYFSSASADEVILLSCEEFIEPLAQGSQNWNVDIQEIHAPEGLFTRTEPDVAEANNLQALLLLGDEIISVGTEFGPSARLVRSANQWLWCQVPLDRATEFAPTPTPDADATEESGE